MSSLSREVLIKRAAEILIYGMDFANLLESGESLVSVNTVAVSGGSGLTAGSGSVVGTQAQFSLTGGTSGHVYQLTVTVTTSAGNVREAAGLLQVE